ncbi:MAG: UPF0149 family protein [Gammaproteobacteria bacterium]
MSNTLHDRVAHVLETLGCDLGAGECHGALCGLLCAPRAFSPRTWLEHLAGEDAPEAFAQGEARAVLDELLRTSVDALGRDDLGFFLLLPDDDAGLAMRSAAFAGWCRGFLAGLGLGGIGDMTDLGADARGFVTDVERFCRVAADAGDEADEHAFAELTEYTRMGVLIIYGEVHAAAAADHAAGNDAANDAGVDAPPTLH